MNKGKGMRKALIFFAVITVILHPVGAKATSEPPTTTGSINGPAVASEPAVREEVPVTDIGTPPAPYTVPPPPTGITLPETK
jgi:hypothetical protein